ncbi:MAG TPA: XdhC/CoxI family protein, partial [Burkholderiaceae bacterium]|nr:XdhC/CoxI family protein [Burkholderiaceae bacterium]
MKPELLELAARLSQAREPFALVSVVRREAPSSAHVGDTALVTRNGIVHGWVGGGCTRSTLLREALRALADGQARLLSLSPEPAREVRAGVTALQMTCQSGGTVDLYVEPVLPRSCLAIFGGTPAARALAHIGTAMGWQVDVFDPDGDATAWPEGVPVARDWAAATLPPGAHVLVALMDERDADAIEAAARLAPAYLGVIASKRRFAKLRESLLARGVSCATVDGIAAPAGLDIGARTPEEIALSVLAQIIALRTRVQAVARET